MRKNSLKRGGNLYVIILYSKPVKPHFPTTQADFEAETPKKENEKKKLAKSWCYNCNIFISKTSNSHFPTTPADFEIETPKRGKILLKRKPFKFKQ